MTENQSHNFDRRADDRLGRDSRVRNEIFEQMSEIEDPVYRVMMTLMLKLQDETQAEIAGLTMVHQGYMAKFNNQLERITAQLEKMNHTEEALKKAVLSTHHTVHDDHHRWIERQMEQDKACSMIVNNHGPDGLCQVAKQALENDEVIKRRKWKVQDMITMGLVLILLASLFPNLVHYFK
jgi:regulator of PEP synthase PpsR (kinase-PPPase family)